MERLLLLWDELDELAGLGWHFAVAMVHPIVRRARRVRRWNSAASQAT